MRILVTGSSGQLGAVIASMLFKQHSVIGADLAPGRFTSRIGDISDSDFVSSVTKNVEIIIHTCSLHAPHLKTHTRKEFIDINIHGTLHLLKSAIDNGVKRFVYTSTTSLYGHAMVSPKKAVWVTEELMPLPRDIYDVTKIAAEGLCQIFAAQYRLPCVSLRVSRYFPESDYFMAIYRLYRGVDVRDAAKAHILAMNAEIETYDVFNISSLSPFSREETQDLYKNAPQVITKHFPVAENVFTKKGWKLPKRIDRVYSIEKARAVLKYRPENNFDLFLE
ncbi:MAG: NAD(P)-dependent oxidoreductase [Candidatus Aminicenantes bacterium]|nr:MAG: NAD(P)-dependent oxidoreductase [Candidatus Aminicenantes bacterium]